MADSQALRLVEQAGADEPDDTEAPYAADFVLDLLAELRASQYRPAGWVRFLGRSWRQARETARAHPELVASWRRTSVGLALGLAGALALEGMAGGEEGRETVWRAGPLAALWLAMAEADTYVHLGLNNRVRGAPIYRAVGVPTALTLARRGIAGLLWGHLLAKRPAGRGSLALALSVALATDSVDGAVARRWDCTTRLGGYMDGLADFELWTALALSLGARRLIPRWLLTVLLVRWLGPLAVAYAAYFGKVSRVPLSSTALGRISGGAQAATLAEALLPDNARRRVAPLRAPLYIVTAALLVAAPVAHLGRLLRVPLR